MRIRSQLLRHDFEFHLCHCFRIDQFFITLAFHSKELSMWTERLRMLMVFRSIADNYTVCVLFFQWRRADWEKLQ